MILFYIWSSFKSNQIIFQFSALYIKTQNRKRFYNAYILPHFDLCCVIWGNCTSVMGDKLVKLQKRAARAVLDVDITVPSETMFTRLKWMTFPERGFTIKQSKCTKQWRCTWLFQKWFCFLHLRFIQDY